MVRTYYEGQHKPVYTVREVIDRQAAAASDRAATPDK
jgi:hypothetical protein